MAIKEKSGVSVSELENIPTLHDGLKHVWKEYGDIRKGCENIGYVELVAYQQATGNNLSPFECSLMLDLEVVRKTNG